MNRELAILLIYAGLPVAATVAWWGAALLRRLKRQPALGSMRNRLVTVHAALLAPAVVMGGVYGAHAAGIDEPWTQVSGAPAAALLWAPAYFFVLTWLFGSAGEEGRFARRLRLAERRMDLYHQIGSATQAALKPRAALYVMLEQLMAEFEMQVGMIHLANERDELSLVTYRNIDSLAAGVLGFLHSGDGTLGQVHSTGIPVQISGGEGIGPGGREVQLGEGIQRVVAVPLRANGANLGVLTLGRQGNDRLPEDDVESLSMVAVQIGGFVEGRGLAQRSAGDVDIAYMRGFVDPHEFIRVMETEVTRARRYERPVTVASVEVSGYDRQGDLETTQQVIRTVADLIRRNLRMADYCAYHDNGRFSLLMPETDSAGCRIVTRRLAELLQGTDDLYGMALGVTVRVASYPEHADTIDDLLQALQSTEPESLVQAPADESYTASLGEWPAPPPGWREAPQAAETPAMAEQSAWQPGTARDAPPQGWDRDAGTPPWAPAGADETPGAAWPAGAPTWGDAGSQGPAPSEAWQPQAPWPQETTAGTWMGDGGPSWNAGGAGESVPPWQQNAWEPSQEDGAYEADEPQSGSDDPAAGYWRNGNGQARQEPDVEPSELEDGGDVEPVAEPNGSYAEPDEEEEVPASYVPAEAEQEGDASPSEPAGDLDAAGSLWPYAPGMPVPGVTPDHNEEHPAA